MKAKILFSILLSCVMYGLQGQVSGTVFYDFNSDGSQQTSGSYTEPGYPGVIITGFGADGTTYGPVTSGSNGSYTLTGVNQPTRIEFSWPESFLFSGASGKTSVQFVSGSTSNVNFGINYPSNYCQTNPPITTTCYTNGDGLLGGSAAGFDAIVTVPYSADGTDVDGSIYTGPVNQSPTSPNHDATFGQVGATWGLAYQRETKDMFVSAFLKRHSGLGTLGLDGIYKVDYSSATPGVSNFVELSNIGINVGSIPARTLPANAGDASTDPGVFALIGKVGIGDIDLSEDGKFLFLTNLFDRKVYRVFVNNPAVVPTSSDVISWDPTNVVPGCSGGVVRPFATKVWQNKIYIGMVCSAETSGTASDLHAYIYSFNFDGTGGTKVIDFPLDYSKGQIISGGCCDNWQAWDDTWYTDPGGSPYDPPGTTRYPQPILSDIEFDVEGSIIIGLMDRNGHMGGHRNAIPSDINQLVNVSTGGDLLRAYKTSAGYVLESGGQVQNSFTGSTLTSAGASNNQGPGSGEFYFADCIDCNTSGTGGFHSELFVGGLALLPGYNEVVTTVFDPINLDSGGFQWFSNTNGAQTSQYQLYFGAGVNEPQFGKANGLSDVEIQCNPAPIEIGNRVWVDTDGDGVQDADEAPIAGVTVQLVKSGTVIATATTDVNGNYYFSSATGTNTASAIYGITQLMPDMEYIGSKQAALGTNSLTTANVGGAGQPDVRDSDGTLVGNNAEVTVMTTSIPVAGANNHTFDFGFTSAPTCTVSIACNPLPQTSCTPPNGSATTTVTGAQGNLTYMWSSGEATSSITGKVAGTYTVTITDDFLPGCTSTCQAVIGSTVTLPTAQCNPTPNSNCATPNGTATVATNADQILWSNGGTTATITGLSANTYTVTVTNTTTGCTNTCQAVVTNSTVSPTCTIATNSQPSCANLTGGSVTVTPSPAGTYTYAWSDNGAATANRTGLTGGTYTVTVTNTTTNCTGVCNVTLTTPTNCCNIAAIVPQNLECLDNGTPGLSTDNRIRFNALVTNTNASLTSYNVMINGGTTTITPNTNVPYGVTQFTLGPGTAGGGATFTVTVTDSATPGCTQTFQVIDPGTCSPAIPECPTPKCGTATIQVNGN